MSRFAVGVLLVACGPRVPADDATDSTASTSTASTTSSTAAAESSTGTTVVDTSGGTTDVTGGSVDCEASTPNCADGCTVVSAHFATWDDPRVRGIEHICVAAGPPVGDHRSTWWKMVDGELRVITSTPECLLDHPPEEIPVEWSECSGTPDEPAACRYLCAQDVCPGEVDMATLQDCVTAAPCADTTGVCMPGTDCLMGALRDRTPGRYRFRPLLANGEIEWLLVVEADGDVRATYIETFGIVCAAALWQPARTCRLAEPQLFDACSSTGSCAPSCDVNLYTLEPGLVECVDEPAACE